MTRFALAVACGVLLASIPAPAQQPPEEAAPGAAVRHSPIRDGRRVPFTREEIEQRLREAGAAQLEDHGADQLRDLNELSRQLAPGVPVPAPDHGAARR